MATASTGEKPKDRTVGNTPSCPHCSSPYIKRARRTTIYDRFISLFYVYPFSCQLCGNGFRLFQPGVRYVRFEEDQREYQRMRVDLPIRLLQGTLNSNGAAIDLSMRGCTVRNAASLPLAAVVKISLKLPNEPDPVTVEAVVRNSSDNRIGLEFLRFEGEDRQRLRQFIQGLLDRQYH
jgi:PilZ domain-containing protein